MSQKDKASVIIVICTNCSQHQWCTHHNEAKYLGVAIELREALRKEEIDCTVIPAGENKLGSFEVWCQDTLLFSKLRLGYFPSVPALMERLLVFCSKWQNGEDVSSFARTSSPIKEDRLSSPKKSQLGKSSLEQSPQEKAPGRRENIYSPPPTPPKPPFERVIQVFQAISAVKEAQKSNLFGGTAQSFNKKSVPTTPNMSKVSQNSSPQKIPPRQTQSPALMAANKDTKPSSTNAMPSSTVTKPQGRDVKAQSNPSNTTPKSKEDQQKHDKIKQVANNKKGDKEGSEEIKKPTLKQISQQKEKTQESKDNSQTPLVEEPNNQHKDKTPSVQHSKTNQSHQKDDSHSVPKNIESHQAKDTHQSPIKEQVEANSTPKKEHKPEQHSSQVLKPVQQKKESTQNVVNHNQEKQSPDSALYSEKQMEATQSNKIVSLKQQQKPTAEQGHNELLKDKQNKLPESTQTKIENSQASHDQPHKKQADALPNDHHVSKQHVNEPSAQPKQSQKQIKHAQESAHAQPEGVSTSNVAIAAPETTNTPAAQE